MHLRGCFRALPVGASGFRMVCGGCIVSVDPQPVRRLAYVCADPAAGEVVAAVAERHGMVCIRFDDAFAAAVELLTHPRGVSILLIAMDGLSGPEMPLLAWAARRRPEMPIWVHGSPARLNGQLADTRVKIVRIEQLDGLLAAAAGEAGPGVPPTAAAISPAAGDSPAQTCPQVLDEAAPKQMQSQSKLPYPEAACPQPTQAESPPADSTQRAGEAEEFAAIEPQAPPVEAPAAPDVPPALKLHPPQVGLGPTLTTEELAVLLGPEESGDN